MDGYGMASAVELSDAEVFGGVPAQDYSSLNTKLSPEQEADFLKWKARYAPNDSGEDYDLRGAYLNGAKPSASNGHFPDTWKKPNHPTFSDQSLYASQYPDKAGKWEGETYIPPQGELSDDDVFGAPSIQPISAPKPSALKDVAKTVGSKGLQGGLQVPMVLGELLNEGVKGPQLLGRGVADTISPMLGVQPQPRGEPWQPFFNSGDVMQMAGLDYQPQTTAGKVAEIPAQIAGSLATSKGIQVVAPKANEFLANQESGNKIPFTEGIPKPTKPLPAGMENLAVLPEAAKGNTFAKSPNPIERGIYANQKISEQFAKDTDLQRKLYSDLNSSGRVYSVKAPDLYSKLDDMIAYLDDKVAIDTPEHRTLTELKEFRESLTKKYGVAPTPDKTAKLPSWKQPMVTQKGAPGQAASGIEPSDLIDLKTTINSGLKPNKFSTAGNAKILEFKKYVQDGLREAASISDEFKTNWRAAEKQAARVGMYKEDSLKPLWQPEDYVAWKAGNPMPADTQSRAAKFLENMNNKAMGRASSLSSILSKQDAKDIFRDAIRYGKSNRPSISLGVRRALTGSPIAGLKTGLAATIQPEEMPLQDLARYIGQMQKPVAPQYSFTPAQQGPMYDPVMSPFAAAAWNSIYGDEQ